MYGHAASIREPKGIGAPVATATARFALRTDAKNFNTKAKSNNILFVLMRCAFPYMSMASRKRDNLALSCMMRASFLLNNESTRSMYAICVASPLFR